jgi:hypothetical protein
VYRTRLLVLLPLLLTLSGCSEPGGPATEASDPKAVQLLESHVSAIRRGDWRTAYSRLTPELKGKITLNQFIKLHAKRKKPDAFPRAIQVVGSERSGDDVIVSFDALFAPAGAGQLVPTPPRRKVRLRRSGETWNLMTHDVLAVCARPEF